MEQSETNCLGVPKKRHLKIAEVCEIVGLSRATIYRKIDSGEFPKPVHLSAMRRVWVTADVAAWLQSVEEARFA